ncbi:MAG: 5-oxoprolinase subunit PxpB [Thiobacillus sp.]|nr:5-oxoprolinase subunit PxpB [Thiobacillus sp.]
MGKSTRGQSHIPPAWRWISERGLRIETGDATLAYYAALISQNLPEIEDMIPADGSLLLIFRRGAGVSADLRAALTAPPVGAPVKRGALHEIAVEYGGLAGPDLPVLAEQAGMDATAYIKSHTAVEYSVAFLGFQPGFPYLQGLPRALHARRRASPRVRVAAGSVAIGGTYTGIYPASGPGGWHIIGRTTAALFDPQREAPVLLMAGDRVRLVPM